MDLLTFALVAAAWTLFCLGLCALGRGWWAWVSTGVLGLAAWWFSLSPAAVPFWTVAGLFAAPVVLTGVQPLRQALVSKHLLRIVGAILPKMSDTEREALEAGNVWWDGELFSGAPDWKKLLDFEIKELTEAEKEFLSGPVEELCGLLDDFEVTSSGDLPEKAWDFIKTKGFMGMIIPTEYGGLGFSAAAHAAVVTKLSGHSITASVTVMVPNSLGPAELLLHYGTKEQKDHYLPRLACGEEVPCFALTEPNAGSDAAAMTSSGVVCKGTYEGEEVLGIRLNWNKRYITLSPIATVVGLAFKLYDPDHLLGDKTDLGITCALVPASAEGVELGERHDPLGIPFMNGPTRGKDVFVPLEAIIGGREQAGRGWRMLMQSLAAGRGISLPSLSAGANQLATRTVGAYATLREQFKLMIGRFEGIEAHLARIAGLTYIVDGARRLTVGAIDAGEKPSVLTAVMKAYSTESMRTVVNDAMDVVGGAGICRGPSNVLAHAYQAVPIGITVEGANILTRTMIIFGQGAIRCHPFVQDEMESVAERDVAKFDRAFFGHVNFVFTNMGRAFFQGLTLGYFNPVPIGGPASYAIRQLSRTSAAFALLADTAMGTLGGNLKRKENICGRLADALAWQYLASGAIKRFVDDGQPERDADAFRWACQHALHEIEIAFAGILANLPNRWAARALTPIIFPLGRRYKRASDRVGSRLARAVLEGGELRESLAPDIFVPKENREGLGRLEVALRKVVATSAVRRKLQSAQKEKRLERGFNEAILDRAVQMSIITATERDALIEAEKARDEAIQVDAFELEQREMAAV